MTIKSKIDKIKESLRLSRNAIIGRGGEISPTAGLAEFPEAIANIPNDLSLAYYVDNTMAYRKTVPAGACNYAYLNSIGGMTYKGFTFDCVVEEFNGEYSAPYSFTFPKAFTFPTDDFYAFAPVVCGRTDAPIGDASGIHYTLSGTTMTGQGTMLVTDIPAGTQLRCIPRFENQETGEYWFPPECFPDLRDAKPTEVVSYGSNLIDFEAFLNSRNVVYRKEGNKYLINSLGNGRLQPFVFTDTPDIYTLSATDFVYNGIGYGRIDLGYYDGKTFTLKHGDFIVADDPKYQASITSQAKVNAFRIDYSNTDPNVPASEKYFGFSEVRLNKGTTALPYSPYREPITYTLPEAITNKLGKGCSDTIFDEYSFVDEKAITRVGEGNFDSAILDTDTYPDVRMCFRHPFVSGMITETASNVAFPVKMPFFDDDTPINQINANPKLFYKVGRYNRNVYFYVPKAVSPDVASFNAWEAQYPLKFVAELASAFYTETAIPTDFNPLIEVEAGGYLEFVNETKDKDGNVNKYEYPVPSTITYAIEV